MGFDNIPNQIYWTKFVLGDQTKFIQPTLPNQIYKIESAKQNVWNVKNQTYQTKSFQSNLQNQINPTNSTKPNLRKIKVKSNLSLSWAWPSSTPACYSFFTGSHIISDKHVLFLFYSHRGWNKTSKQKYYAFMCKIRPRG